MVMRAFLVVLALAASSAAEKRTARLADVPPYCVGGRPPKVKWNRLGTSLGNGLVRIDDAWMTTMSLAVAIDRPVIGAWRVLAEYEYLWLGRYDWESDVGVASLPDSGHRAHLGLRRELVEKRWSYGRVRAFVDGEAGGGAMLVDRMTGDALAVPHAFVGVRTGLSLVQHSSRWDYEVVVRGLATTEGIGVLFGIGLAWGE